MLQGFTRDVEALSAAVTRATSSVLKEDAPMLPGRAASGPRDTAFAKVGDIELSATERSTIASDNADPQFRETILRMQALASTIDTSQRGHATLYPLMVLARAHASLEGRKAMLLFSEGLQVPSSVEESFRDRDQRGESRQRQHLRRRRARPRHGSRPPVGRGGAGEGQSHQPAGHRPERRRSHVDGRDAERRSRGRVAAVIDASGAARACREHRRHARRQFERPRERTGARRRRPR